MYSLFEIIASLGSGAIVGLILGMIGGGGSILATPLMLYVVGIGQPHVAIGTGAVAVAVNAWMGLLAHARRGNVCWGCAALFAAVGTAGALGGASLGKRLDGQLLLFLFGLSMIAVALAMLRPRGQIQPGGGTATRRNCVRAAVAALVAGGSAGFFGIGGGFLIVPALMLATGMPLINAVGSSLLAVGSFGLATSLNYAASGLVNWPVAGMFILGGLGGSFAGTNLSLRLSDRRQVLVRIFAAVVLAVAAYILYRSGSLLIAS